MYVEHWTPADVKHPYPVVLVHGGTGQMLHYMGNGDGQAGWAHYYLQAGYRVYMVDRPGHGRAPYHPDALGPIGPQPSYEMIVPDSGAPRMVPTGAPADSGWARAKSAIRASINSWPARTPLRKTTSWRTSCGPAAARNCWIASAGHRASAFGGWSVQLVGGE